jgi:Flp pilus assembly pilin Flp
MQSPVAVALLKTIDVRFRRPEEGQDLLEYGLLMAMIAIVAMGAVASLGTTISSVFWTAIASNF